YCNYQPDRRENFKGFRSNGQGAGFLGETSKLWKLANIARLHFQAEQSSSLFEKSQSENFFPGQFIVYPQPMGTIRPVHVRVALDVVVAALLSAATHQFLSDFFPIRGLVRRYTISAAFHHYPSDPTCHQVQTAKGQNRAVAKEVQPASAECHRLLRILHGIVCNSRHSVVWKDGLPLCSAQ
ncbi:hypothetical protein ANCCAN_02146, partial [Ancylostoma caninum]